MSMMYHGDTAVGTGVGTGQTAVPFQVSSAVTSRRHGGHTVGWPPKTARTPAPIATMPADPKQCRHGDDARCDPSSVSENALIWPRPTGGRIRRGSGTPGKYSADVTGGGPPPSPCGVFERSSPVNVTPLYARASCPVASSHSFVVGVSSRHSQRSSQLICWRSLKRLQTDSSIYCHVTVCVFSNVGFSSGNG